MVDIGYGYNDYSDIANTITHRPTLDDSRHLSVFFFLL